MMQKFLVGRRAGAKVHGQLHGVIFGLMLVKTGRLGCI
jgi:hypothetical protein